MSRAGLGVQETQLLSPLRRCQGCFCLCGKEETVVQGKDPSPEPTKPWCKFWQVTDKLCALGKHRLASILVPQQSYALGT